MPYAINITGNTLETQPDDLKKLQIISDLLSPVEISGVMNNDYIELSITTTLDHYNLIGNYDGNEETLPTRIYKNNNYIGTFNSHPHGQMGELVIRQFKRDLHEILALPY